MAPCFEPKETFDDDRELLREILNGGLNDSRRLSLTNYLALRVGEQQLPGRSW
jgi:hypothetical protein